MPTTYIIGHTKPDTDAVVAAMAFEYLCQQWPEFGYKQPQAVIADPLNPETSFVFKKYGVKTPPQITARDIAADDTIVLVDHNETSQQLEKLPENQIVEIIDHHKANLNLNTPIFMTFKPWGSTSTIVYYLMKKYGVKPGKTLAGLMLAAILSDTVGFKSATTTAQDKTFGTELAEMAGVSDIDALALDIFKAKSDISKLSDEEIVSNDFKIYDFSKKTMISQLETVEQATLVSDKKADLLQAMASVKEKQGVELFFVVITDVLQVNSKLLILGDAEQAIAEQAFGGKVTDHILDIGSKMSRKKEIAPPIERTLQE